MEATTLQTEKPAPTKLYLAMHKARAAMSVVGRSGFNGYDKYKYATLADYLDAIQKPLDENGLVVVSHIDEITWLDDRMTERGKSEKVCRIMLRTMVIHAESGESLSVTVLGEGQDRGDKAFYKADTGARKYALANLFNLATDDDPETESPQNGATQQPAAKPQNFNPPPGWPDTPAADLAKWVAALTTTPALKTALGMFTNEQTLQSVLTDWEVVMMAVASKYKALTANFTKFRDSAFEQEVKRILEKIELDKQGMETFSPPAEPAAT